MRACACVCVCVTASSAPCPLSSDVVVSIVALNQSLILSLVKCAVNKQRKSGGVSLFLPGSCPVPLGPVVTSPTCAKGRKGNAWALRHFCCLCGPANPALSFGRVKSVLRPLTSVQGRATALWSPLLIRGRKTRGPAAGRQAHAPAADASFSFPGLRGCDLVFIFDVELLQLLCNNYCVFSRV